MERVAVIFYNKEHIPAERFIFKLSMDQSYGSKVESNDLEFALRAFLVKLSVAEPLTKALPPGNFEILAFSFFSQFTCLSPMMEKSGDS